MYAYATAKVDGLRLLRLCDEIDIQTVTQVVRMLTSPDTTLRHLARSELENVAKRLKFW